MARSDNVMSDEDFDSFLNSPSQTKEAASDVMSDEDFDSFLNNSSVSPASTDVQAGLEQFASEAPVSTWESGDGGAATLPEGETNQWGGNLRNEGRKPLIRRDANGKVNGYSTTTSMLVRHDDGKFAVVPTVVDGEELSPEDAVRHYAETGEYWGVADDEEGAKKIARAVHEKHAELNRKQWNEYLQNHWDELSDEIRNDPGMRGEHSKRRREARVKEAGVDKAAQVASKKKEQVLIGQSVAGPVYGEKEIQPATVQVAPDLFLTGDVLDDSEGRTVKPGQFVTLSRKDGTSQLLSFEGASKDGKPVFKEVKGVATAGADLAGEINISEDDYNRMFDAGNAKVDRPFWEQVRHDALANTGDAYRYTDDARGTFNAFYDYLMPFLGGSAKKENEERTRILSDIREGRLDGYDGKDEAEKLRDAARKAKLEPWNPLESLHPGESDEDFAQRIRREAEDELKLGAAAKGRAEQARQQTEATVGDKILKGGVESGAFALQFAIPGSIMFKGLSSMGMGAKAVRALTMLGSAIPATIAEADKRYSENITPEYGWKQTSLDGEPEFGMVAAPDAPGEAAYKAIGGAVFDSAVEVGLEAATMGLLRLAGKSAGWLLGKATPGAVKEWGAKKFNRFMASETGQALWQINRAYQDFAGMTQINSPFGELAEENVQALEKVLNLDGKTSEYKGLQKEWNEFYDRQFNADTQWDIFYGLIVQLGLGAAKSTAEGVARHMSEADVRRDVRMALARSGISEATLKTLTPEQQKKLDDLWRQYSADPDALKENVKDLGISMRLAVDELLSRESSKMAADLKRNGIPPEEFVIQTGADGKPAFQKMTRFTPDGKKASMNAMTDAAHGVTIVDRGDGTFYVMNDLRGLDAIPADSFANAQAKANAEVMRNQRQERLNKIAAQRLMELMETRYAGRNVVSIPSEAALRWQVAQAVRDGRPLYGITRADQLFEEDGSLKQPGAGGFHTPDGHIVVILDNVPSPAEMERVLAHEATGHEGVESATGRGAKTVEFIQNAQAEGFNRFVEGERQRAIQRRVAEGVDEATATAQVDAAMATDDYKRESMARYAQGRLHAPTWYERRKHEANERRRRAGENVPTDQADLEVMLAEQEAQGRAGDNELETLNADSGVRYEEGAADETGNGAAEAPAQPEQGEERGQEAPRPEAGAEPGAQAPDAGVVEPSNTAENLRDASDKASQALQDAESRLSKWLKDHPRQETEDGRVSYGNGGTVREYRELEAAVEAARGKSESAEAEYRKAKRAEDAERQKSEEQKKLDAKKRRDEERKKWRDENPVTAQLEDLEKNVLLPAENELEDLLDSDASTNEQKAEAYRKVREARKVVDDFKNQHKEELEQEAANRKAKENANGESVDQSKSDNGGQNPNTAPEGRSAPADTTGGKSKTKGKRGDNLRGYSYEDYAAHPDDGGTGDQMGAELLRFARDNGGLLKIPPKGAADPLADWIAGFMDGNARKNRRGDFIALFGMKPRTGTNDALVENMPPDLQTYVGNMIERDGPGAVADWFLETRRKYREWAQGRRDAAREERLAAKDRAEEGEALESFDFDELAAARDAMDEEFANALGVVEGADEADYAALTPANLQIAKSGDTIRFDHDARAFNFGSFDTERGILTVYDEEAAGRDGEKFRRVYRVTENSIEEIDDGQGNEVRADADRAGDEKGPAGGGGEAQGGGFQLESVTAEQITAEEKKRREKAEIKKRQEAPLKGSGAVNVQSEMDLGQTGQQDLFSPIAENEETPPAAKEKAAERPAEYLAWLEKYKMKDTDRRFAEWQRKQSAQKPVKTAPASAPRAEGTTTPPKSAEAPQVVKTTRDGESIRIVENGREYEVELPDVKFPKTFTKATSKADWEAKMAEAKKIADELKKKAPFHSVINPKTGKYYANDSEVARQRRREVAAYEEAVRRATNQAFDEIGEYNDSWDEAASPSQTRETAPASAQVETRATETADGADDDANNFDEVRAAFEREHGVKFGSDSFTPWTYPEKGVAERYRVLDGPWGASVETERVDLKSVRADIKSAIGSNSAHRDKVAERTKAFLESGGDVDALVKWKDAPDVVEEIVVRAAEKMGVGLTRGDARLPKQIDEILSELKSIIPRRTTEKSSQVATPPEAAKPAEGGKSASGSAPKSSAPTTARTTATPAFKRGDRVFIKGAKDGQRVTFLKANADGTADVQVRTPGANRYAPEKVETRTVPMGDISSTGMKDTLTDAERNAYRRGMAEQTRESMRNDPALRRIDAAYRAAKTDAERNALKAQFAERVRALQGGVNFDTPGIYTGTAADYANRSRRGGVDDGPSLQKIGSGEGSQVYGWGLYGSAVRGVADRYAKNGRGAGGKDWIKEGRNHDELSDVEKEAASYLKGMGSKQAAIKRLKEDIEWFEKQGIKDEAEALKPIVEELSAHGDEYREQHENVYEQTFFTDRAPGDESHLLEWYEPVSEENANRILDRLSVEFGSETAPSGAISSRDYPLVYANGERASGFWTSRTGEQVYNELSNTLGSPQAASEFLARAGIDGVKYPVDSYGGKGVKDGDKVGWNYVSFRDDNIRVDHKWTDGVLQFDTPELSSVSPEEDAAYMDAVRRGDMGTARRMVREAAARAGYDVFAYHGTKGDFTVFDKEKIGSANDEGYLGRGFYFWSENNLPYAYQYAGADGKVMQVYLKVQEPHFIEREELESLIAASDRHDTEYILSFTRDLKNNGYDSVVDDNGQILVFDSNAIKSADPVTYDDAGNVIPLSQRFNLQNEDIRFDTPELTPAEAEYAASDDKTPTEKVMREVYGMTNDEIATALRASGMEPPAHVRKTDADMWRQVETLLSNSTYMAKLSRAVAKFPRPTRDYENVALNVLFRQRQAAVNDLERRRAELAAIPEDDMNKKPELRDELKQVSAKLAQAKAQMAEAGKAAMMGASEQGRALRSNRALIDAHDYSYAGIAGRIAQTLGGVEKITPEMNARIRDLAKLFEGLDEEGLRLATERLIPLSKKVIDQTKNGLKVRKATERKVGDVARKIAQNYQDALTQIEVGAVETGGTLIGLSDQQYPSWGKWLRQIGEYHCFLNPEITEEEVIDAIVRDISPFMEGVDANQVRDALTGFGHNYKQSRYDAQRLMNSLRNISRSKRQIDWMDETNTMPPATGPIRDEPTQDEREWAKRVRDRKEEVPDAGRDERRLKSTLNTIKRNLENRIADLKRAIETGERIPAPKRKVVDDIRVRELRAEKDELQKRYDELFGTTRTLTPEQKIAMAEKTLNRMLEADLVDLDRARQGDFSKAEGRPAVTEQYIRRFERQAEKGYKTDSPVLQTLRERRIETLKAIFELKKAKYAFGMTPEEIEALNARKIANREKAVARLAERVATGDFRTGKPQPPMTPDQQKRYDELGEQMKRGRQKLAELRLEAENATVPTFVRKGVNFLRFVTTAQRALRATMDFSAVLRQAARMTLGHPVKAAQAFGKAWTAARSEASLLDVNTEILSDPTVQEAVRKFGLHLRDVDAQSDRDVEMFYGMERNKVKIFGKEYAITDIPLFGEFMLKSERHYLTYLNAMSADLYTSIVNGIPGGATPWQKKMIADMINIWNGSAALSKERRQALQKAWVNDIFWAPQLAISRVQSAVGYDIWHPLVAKGIKNADGTFEKVSNDERKTAAKIGLREHMRSTVAMLAIGALLKWLFSDDDDKYDFSQADWLEKMMMLVSPKIGNTTIDLTGGESTFNRLVHQLATKSKRSGTGRLMKFGDFNGPTTMGTIGRYLQGKLSPSASTIVALWEGKDYVGEEYGVGNMVREMLVPLTFEDVKDQLEQNGIGRSLVTVPLSILGAGGSTYDRKPYENAVNRFLEAKKEYDAIQGDDSVSGDERNRLLSGIRDANPLMRDDVRGKISAYIKGLRTMESTQKKAQKAGRPTNELDARIERRKAEILDMIRAARK